MKYIRYTILILASVLTFSCIQNPSGLFYSLQYESGITDGPLDNGLTVGGIASANGYYFIAAEDFRYRTTGASLADAWETDLPDALAAGDYSCRKLVLLDDLYVVFHASETQDFRLFKADTSAVSGGISWTEVVLANIGAGEYVVDIAENNSTIFIYTEKAVTDAAGNADRRYAVYSTAAASLANTTALSAELSNLDSYGEFAVDNDGTDYWLISGNHLYSRSIAGAPGSWGLNLASDVLAAVNASSTRITGRGFGGLICITGGTGADGVYVSTEEGALVKYSGGSWTDLTADALLSPLYRFERITESAESIDIVLLGSSAGYYEMSLSAAAPAFISAEKADTKLTNKVQFASIEMSNDVITDFYYDGANSRLFGLGYSSGLWSNTPEPESGERTWVLE